MMLEVGLLTYFCINKSLLYTTSTIDLQTSQPSDIYTQTTMAESTPFQFLDLPAETRLMVYEQLTINTTYHDIGWLPKTDHHRNYNRMSEYEDDLAIVHRSLPGITLLATCRLINEETTSILRSKLNAMRNGPIRLLGTEHTDPYDIVNALHYIFHATCPIDELFPALNMVRKQSHVPQTGGRTEVTRRAVEVAIPVSTSRVPLANINGLGLIQFIDLCYSDADELDWGDDNLLSILHTVNLRPIVLDAKDSVDFDMSRQIFDQSALIRNGRGQAVVDSIAIREQEWEENWVEGEEYL